MREGVRESERERECESLEEREEYVYFVVSMRRREDDGEWEMRERESRL